MKKVKQIPLDKVLPLLQLGMPAACWRSKSVDKEETIVSILAEIGASPDLIASYTEFHSSEAYMISHKKWEEEGTLFCYTLVDADED